MNIETLFSAIRNDDLDRIAKEIDGIQPDQFDEQTNDGELTALMLACEVASLDTIKFLLKHGAEPTYELKWSSNSTLKSLAKGVHDDMETLNVIFEAIGEPYIKAELNSSGDDYADMDFEEEVELLSPLQIAEQQGKDAYVEAFKSKGARS